MSRCVIYLKNGNFVNLEANEILDGEECIRVYNGNMLVGIFSLTMIEAAYITTKTT